MNRHKAGFTWRVFSSFGLAFSFFLILITGLILYFAPAGRISRWIGWEFTWMNKTEWIALHTVFSYVFIGFAIFHLFVFNWKAFWSYLTKKTQKGMHKKREFAWAGIITVVIFFGTLFQVPPFQSIMDFGDYLSGTWGRETIIAPFPHTEKLSIEELTEKIPFLFKEEVMERLVEADIHFENEQQSLQDIANYNFTSPAVVYHTIVGDSKHDLVFMSPGSLTTGGLAEILKISFAEIQGILSEMDIDANERELLKDVAKRYGTTPGRIVRSVKEGLHH